MAFVYTKLIIDWDGNVIEWAGYNWSGPVAECCGSSSTPGQQQIAAQQQQFFNTLTSNYQQQFAGQTAILQSLTSAFSPILAGGINQFGYSPQETAAMRTQAAQGTAQAYSQASQAVGSQLSALGGGQEFLPSGGMGQIEAQLAGSAALQNSQEQLGITTAGYQQGTQNFLNAAQALGGVAQQYNPTAYAGQATAAGNAAFGSQTQLFQQQQATNPWNVVGGVLGGAVGTGLGMFTGGLGLMGAQSLGNSMGLMNWKQGG